MGGQGALQGRERVGGQAAAAGPVASGVLRTVGEYWGPWGGAWRGQGQGQGQEWEQEGRKKTSPGDTRVGNWRRRDSELHPHPRQGHSGTHQYTGGGHPHSGLETLEYTGLSPSSLLALPVLAHLLPASVGVPHHHGRPVQGQQGPLLLEVTVTTQTHTRAAPVPPGTAAVALSGSFTGPLS